MLTKITPLFSASHALCKWLKADLPIIPTNDDKQIGTQPLVTDANTVSWQCHVIFTDSWRQHATVIAVEAHSLFTLLLPFDVVPTQQKLEQRICEQWANELVELLLRQGEIDRNQVARFFNLFHQYIQNCEWVRNTDSDVKAHITDAEHWVKQTLFGRGLDALDDDLAMELAWQFNIQQKQVKDSQGNPRRFYPPALFLEDGLARFIHVNDRPHVMLTGTDKTILLSDFLNRKNDDDSARH